MVGLGNFLETPFDFTNMSRGQVIGAAQTLRSEGKLSGNEAAVLEGFACAYAAAPGQQLPAQYSLTDQTKYNFFDMIKQASGSDHAHGESLAAANDDALLGGLTQYTSIVNAETNKTLMTYL